MTWHIVTRRDSYLSARRRINPDSQKGDVKTHEEVYLGRIEQVGLPPAVVETAMNTYWGQDKPEKWQVMTTLSSLRAKREGRKPIPVRITIL